MRRRGPLRHRVLHFLSPAWVQRRPVPALMVFESLKLLRETLCKAQNLVAVTDDPDKMEDLQRLAGLIREIDRHRPLGPDGKHGRRHTDTCGCER